LLTADLADYADLKKESRWSLDYRGLDNLFNPRLSPSVNSGSSTDFADQPKINPLNPQFIKNSKQGVKPFDSIVV